VCSGGRTGLGQRPCDIRASKSSLPCSGRLTTGCVAIERLSSFRPCRQFRFRPWRATFRLDLADFERRARREPDLAPVLCRWRGVRPVHPGSLHEYLVIAIVLQDATVRRSVEMLQALLQRRGFLAGAKEPLRALILSASGPLPEGPAASRDSGAPASEESLATPIWAGSRRNWRGHRTPSSLHQTPRTYWRDAPARY
jgi:hypothetical protein